MSVRAYVFRPKAAGDIKRAHLWYERQRRGLGDELLSEVQGAVSAVLDGPTGFPVVHRQIRRALVRRFPYALFFRIVDATVVFIACMHTRRDPERWQQRR